MSYFLQVQCKMFKIKSKKPLLHQIYLKFDS